MGPPAHPNSTFGQRMALDTEPVAAALAEVAKLMEEMAQPGADIGE
jgi:hypothetical protein